MSSRLPQGGLVDRSQNLSFTFNGHRMEGYAGDTLAAALIANGVRIVGRSFKYHRPRGIFAAGLEDPNAMLSVRDGYGTDPAIRAGQVQLVEGLDVNTVTGWPSSQFDLGAVAQLAAPLFVSGFYYKTMMWPNWSWFEGLVRHSTGFGRVCDTADTRRYEHRHDTCDVLIIGAGPAGLSAATALIGTGMRIVIVDDQLRSGGCLNWEDGKIDGKPAKDWAKDVVATLEADGMSILNSTTVCGAYEGNFFTLLQSLHDASGVAGEVLWKLRATHVVLATGAIERPLVFQNNDRPGVMLSTATRRFLNEYAVTPGKTIAVYTNNDSAYLTAIAAQRAGIDVSVLIDSRPKAAAPQSEFLESLGVPCVYEAEIADTAGYRGLKRISIASQSGRSQYDCDALAVSGGWTPLIHLAAQRGSKPQYDDRYNSFLCPNLPDGWRVTGGAAGALSLDDALTGGHAAGQAIAWTGRSAPTGKTPFDFGQVAPMWRAKSGKPTKMWIDLQNDVKVSDVAVAALENYVSVEHLKRYTTLGMGTDQGRTSNVNGMAILADETNRDINSVGTTTFRPPYVALRMGAIAQNRQSDQYRPRRQMPAHANHVAAGAVFDDFGWERPDWYRDNGANREQAVAVEMATVRDSVGIFDGSPLGKIEVAGPDAQEFLNRFYVSNLMTLKPGRVRYSVMLHEDGVIFDDGVVACVDDALFVAGPTSGNAETVAAWFEHWRQTEWPHMKVAIAPVTSNWASIALAGPRARDLLEGLEPSFDVSSDAFPHMNFREGQIAGVPARIARVSFTGELQYEITVPSRYGAELLEKATELGVSYGIKLIGMEAWLRLRLEKGYIHVGSDTNGRTTPLDLGMGNIVAKKHADFIGKRSLTLPYATSSKREQLVGLRSNEGPLEVGARVLAPNETKPPCATVGYITSACISPSAGHIALALVERGADRLGEFVRVFNGDQTCMAEICSPVFVDPTNERLLA